MPRGYPALNETQKQEIIRRVTDNGEKVSELSKEYGVVSKTIYKLLGRKANQSSAVPILLLRTESPIGFVHQDIVE